MVKPLKSDPCIAGVFDVEMKIGFLYILIGTVTLTYGVQDWGVRWLLCWFGLAYLTLGVAYLRKNSRILGKKANGKLSIYTRIALFPYLLINWSIWHALRIFRKDATHHQILPDLYVGRRLLSEEYPDYFDSVLDLTSEFSEPEGVLARHGYYSLPILDGCGISETALIEVLRKIFQEDRVLFIHCAEGHGRAGMVAAVAMLLKGVAHQPEEAIQMVKNKRPKVKLNHEQTQTVIAAWKFLQKGGA